MQDIAYKQKYLKYKAKYLELKGGEKVTTFKELDNKIKDILNKGKLYMISTYNKEEFKINSIEEKDRKIIIKYQNFDRTPYHFEKTFNSIPSKTNLFEAKYNLNLELTLKGIDDISYLNINEIK